MLSLYTTTVRKREWTRVYPDLAAFRYGSIEPEAPMTFTRGLHSEGLVGFGSLGAYGDAGSECNFGGRVPLGPFAVLDCSQPCC